MNAQESRFKRVVRVPNEFWTPKPYRWFLEKSSLPSMAKFYIRTSQKWLLFVFYFFIEINSEFLWRLDRALELLSRLSYTARLASIRWHLTQRNFNWKSRNIFYNTFQHPLQCITFPQVQRGFYLILNSSRTFRTGSQTDSKIDHLSSSAKIFILPK